MGQYRTALYGRTSPHDRKKLTIESQQKALRDWAVRDELVSTVAGEFWDATITGKIPLWDRPEGTKLLHAIDHGLIDSVAVLYIDRLGRTTLDSLKAAAELESKKIKLVAIADGWDARKDDDPLYFQIRAAIAEAEHRRIKSRFERGKQLAIERDNAPPAGSLIFGYRILPNGHFVIDPIESAIVRHVFQMIDSGETYLSVLAFLRSANVAPGRRFQGRRAPEARIISTHKNARWHHGRIGQMLRQRAYIGERHWGGRVFPCPRIVEQDQWDRVQIRIDNWTRRYHNQRGNGLCSALLRCGLCGYRYYYTLSRPTDRHAHYVCLGKKHGGCQSSRPRVADLDAQVWSKLCEYLEDPARIIRLASMRCGSAEDSLSALDAEERDVQTALQKIDGEVAEIQASNSEMPFSWILPLLESLNKKRIKLLEKEKGLQGRRAALQLDKADVERAIALLQIDAGGLVFADAAKRREILRQHVSELVLHADNQLHISFRWGCEDNSSMTSHRGIVLVSLAFPIADPVQYQKKRKQP